MLYLLLYRIKIVAFILHMYGTYIYIFKTIYIGLMFTLQEACCGIDGYKDWRRYDTSWSNETPDMSIVVPRSCCQAQARNGESCNIEGTELEINRGVRMHGTSKF